jgi:glycerol-3-phosphate acyltransferase PlsY
MILLTAMMKILALLISYLLGSIPVGLLLVRASTGKDIREVGSGRIGGTNALRAGGPWIALLTGFGDVLKGFLAVLVGHALVGTPIFEALAGVLAVVGHNYSVFIGFHGGAGTAATLGGAIALWPWNGPAMLVVGTAVIALSRYASMGSITVAILLPALYALRAGLGSAPWGHLIHGLGTMALTLWALRPNIQRLLEGCERQVVIRKSA